jgi:hypothetical protein
MTTERSGLQDTGAAVTNAVAKAKGHDSMERSETVRRTVGAAYAVGCVEAAARTVSAGVTFCGKALGTPYNLREGE